MKDEKSKKADGKRTVGVAQIIFTKHFWKELFSYWLLLPTMADTNFFLIGCMKRQHAVILESIWEKDSIVTRFPA